MGRNKTKAVQKFSDEYLERCSQMTTEQIAKFLDDFRKLHGGRHTSQLVVNSATEKVREQGKRKPKSKLISLKVPEDLLNVFKTKAALTNTPYQTQIKVLMKEWLN